MSLHRLFPQISFPQPPHAMARPEGVRFLIYPQPRFLEGFENPEVVTLPCQPGEVGPGPQDKRMYALYPIGKPRHFGPVEDVEPPMLFMPPWSGAIMPPAIPGPDGHFDHLIPGTPQFECAHMYACARLTLGVWENYFGREMPWHFRRHYDRMELTTLHSFDNGYMGYGFMELGADHKRDPVRPYSLNFDVIAHEMGHALIYSLLGLPDGDDRTGEYMGFHESAADLVAMLTSLHFRSVREAVLNRTRGNLYAENVMSRTVELTKDAEIRLVSNNRTMSEFADGWRDEHHLGEPLTGAVFDSMIDMFHEICVIQGLIPREVEDLSDKLLDDPSYHPVMQAHFDEAYARNPQGFHEALVAIRDQMGVYLARCWDLLDGDDLTYAGVGDLLMAVDRELSAGMFQRAIETNFRMRGIGSVQVGPQLEKLKKTSHAASLRTFVPDFSD